MSKKGKREYRLNKALQNQGLYQRPLWVQTVMG